MAQRYWPGQDPIGHVIRIGDLIKGPLATIVGIVDDARYLALESPSVRPMLYFSAISHPQRGMMLVVRHAIDVQMAPTLRSLVSLVDARLPSPTATSMDALLSDATSSRRFALVLFGVFAIAALVLALVGLYGVLSYLVRLRGVEMGVRLALGASRRSLLASVMGSAMRLVAAGLIIGLVGAKLVMGAMKALLYGVQPTDALTYGAIALLLAFTGALASLMPAWRATRTDPIVALRQGG
jgi:ABC-type antimicrobial peptide transport system permease subunit